MNAKVKTQLELRTLPFKQKEKATALGEVVWGEGRGRGGTTRFLRGLPGLFNIPAMLCIWKRVSSLKWGSGKGRDERSGCGGGLRGGMGSFLRVEVCALWMDVALAVGGRATAGPL